jgi:hypothetical protein
MQPPTLCHVICARAAARPTGWECLCPQSGDPTDALVPDGGAVGCRDSVSADVGERERGAKLPHLHANRGARRSDRRQGQRWRRRNQLV